MVRLLLEIAVIVLLVLTFGTQVFYPLWRGRPIFPALAAKRRELETELTDLHEEFDETGLGLAVQAASEELRLRRLKLMKKPQTGVNP